MQINYATEWHNKMLGRYRLGHVLGRGGMGEVWQAEDTKLHRQVAVKLLPSVVANETDYLRAFTDEACTIASLEHPHILPIHDFGEEPEGEHVVTYLIMPLIPGGSLRERIHISQGLLPVKEGLHYLRQAAEAIDYAHSRQVLHRDIKPANMLLQQQWLFLADFGLAKLLSTDAKRNHTYAGAGTPDYMAPEQVQGKAEAASDRYSLAVIAYQIFSGHKPFSGADPYEILLKQIQEPPSAPRQFNPHMPQAVEDTLLKGLAKQPAERPLSSIAFINELERGWLADPSFQQTSDQKSASHPEEDPEATLLAPWSKRYIADLATHQVAAPIVVSTDQPYSPIVFQEHSTPITVQQETSNPSTSTPERPQETEKAPSKIGRRGLLIGGSAAVVAIAGGTGLAAYIHSRSIPTPQPTPGPHKLIAGIPLLRLEGHTDAVWDVAWHPSGRYITTAGADTHTMLWDVESSLQKKPKAVQKMKQPLHKWKFADRIDDNMISWSKDGRILTVLSASGVSVAASSIINFIINLQNIPTIYSDKKAAASFNEPLYLNLAWSPVDNLLAVSMVEDTDIQLWQPSNRDGPTNTLSGTQLPPNQAGSISVANLAWSHDGTLLAGIQTDYKAVVWNIKTGKIQQTLVLPAKPNAEPPLKIVGNQKNIDIRRNAISWSPHIRNHLVTSNIDTAAVWDAIANKLLFTLYTDDPVALTPTVLSDTSKDVAQLNGLAWSPNGRYIAGSYEHSHQIYIWDTLNKHPRKTQEGFHAEDLRFGQTNGHFNHTDSTIIDLAWSPDGRYLATASNDTTVIIWRIDGA